MRSRRGGRAWKKNETRKVESDGRRRFRRVRSSLTKKAVWKVEGNGNKKKKEIVSLFSTNLVQFSTNIRGWSMETRQKKSLFSTNLVQILEAG